MKSCFLTMFKQVVHNWLLYYTFRTRVIPSNSDYYSDIFYIGNYSVHINSVVPSRI